MEQANQTRVREALEALPLPWREVLVLRELEGLSYREIADVAAIKMGTVMSRLARARAALQQQLAADRPKGDR
jgi:RNA polymerase sigma-70 factor (ECF subfamily)